MDLRARIFEARQDGDRTAEVAEWFAVSPAFVRRLLQRHRETGLLAPRSARRGPRPSKEGQFDRIRASRRNTPTAPPRRSAISWGYRCHPGPSGGPCAAWG